MKKERINEIWGVFFLLLGLFALCSLIGYNRLDISFYTPHPNNPVKNYTGIIGAYTSFGLFLSFGWSAFVIPVLFLIWAWSFLKQRVPDKRLFKFVGLFAAIAASATLSSVLASEENRIIAGGCLGHVSSTYLLKYFGFAGSLIVSFCTLMLALILATDYLLFPLVEAGMHLAAQALMAVWPYLSKVAEAFYGVFSFWKKSSRAAEKPKKEKIREPEPVAEKAKKEKPKKESEPKPAFDEKIASQPIKVKAYQPGALAAAEELKKEILEETIKPPVPPKAPAAVKPKLDMPKGDSAAEESSFKGVIGSASKKKYQMPSRDLLVRPLAAQASNDNLEANSKIIEQTLSEFGIEVKVTEVEQGPVITRYELLPAPGVKLNSIANLSDNLSLALKATSVRMIIPIPGKSAVGIEIPNSVTNMVYLRELVETSEFTSGKNPLPLILGKDTSGKPLISDLAGMPHMLIAGTTGSGKTVCVNAIISGLLYSRTPDELKFVMVDPKMVEMAIYNKIPHMLTPVVTDVKKAAHAINWVVQEMEKRYRLLATVGVRNIASFNSRVVSEENRAQLAELEAKAENGSHVASENIIPLKLPYIVVVIDELADLMMTMRDKVEGPICRLAQLSRAVGIHLILATQRPSVDVITGVIKANFPARVSFKVSSKVDSRTVLDGNGADQLIGKGDLLFLKPGEAKLIRGQAPFVTDDEIRNVVEHWAKQGNPEFLQELTVSVEKKAGDNNGEKDELYDEALRVVLETRVASTSNLQRRMGLGYTRAARIMDQLEFQGVIGPSQGAKPREIYLPNPNAAVEQPQPSGEQA